MAYTIHIDQLMRHEHNLWSGEAAELAFPIGRWPLEIDIEGTEGGTLRVTHAAVEHGGDLHIYRGDNLTVHVFND